MKILVDIIRAFANVLAMKSAPKKPEAVKPQPVMMPNTRYTIDHVATGAVMADARESLGLSQKEMAVRLGMSATYLCDLEQGRRNWSEALLEKWWTAARNGK